MSIYSPSCAWPADVIEVRQVARRYWVAQARFSASVPMASGGSARLGNFCLIAKPRYLGGLDSNAHLPIEVHTCRMRLPGLSGLLEIHQGLAGIFDFVGPKPSRRLESAPDKSSARPRIRDRGGLWIVAFRPVTCGRPRARSRKMRVIPLLTRTNVRANEWMWGWAPVATNTSEKSYETYTYRASH